MPYYNCKICGHRSNVRPTCEHIKLQERIFKLVNDCLKDPINVVEKIDDLLIQQYSKPSTEGENVNSQKWGGLSAWNRGDLTESVDKHEEEPVQVYESRRGYFVSLKIRRELRADGDVEHNHIDCVACGAKNVGTNEYLDLDEAEVQHIKCNNCEIKYTLVEGKWYSPEGASVYYPKDHTVTEEKKQHRNAHGN